jgi:hypothetical protein
MVSASGHVPPQRIRPTELSKRRDMIHSSLLSASGDGVLLSHILAQPIAFLQLAISNAVEKVLSRFHDFTTQTFQQG